MSSNGSLAEESSDGQSLDGQSLDQHSLDEEPLNRKSPCPICGDLDRWTLQVDHVKLQESAAAKDCVGCMLLFEALSQFDVDFSSLVYSDDIMSKDYGGRSIRVSGEGYPRVSVGDDLDIEIYASAGADEAPLRLVQATEVHASTGSEAAMAQISSWLQNCTDNHKDGTGCPPNLDVPLPTRLIEVHAPASTSGAVDSVRLVETSPGATGSFACLSHCWGLKPLLRTLTSNHADHKTGIALATLPPTFRDAIGITRSLGIPYLWIDSLCIVQDDPADWEREAAQMARMYQNGRVTITASNSEGSDGGCFVDTTRYLSKPVVVVNSQGMTYNALARVKIEHGGWPVLDRGWIFQERLLSPRVLHFGHAEVVWECFGGLACGCGRVGAGGFQRFDFMKGKKTMEDQWTVSPDYTDLTDVRMSKGWMVARWRELVSTYSRLRLTYLKDLFPAMSGSARQLQRMRGGVRYLAGLWEDTLVEDLLWEGQERWSPRPDEWHAPTWSWAAVSGGAFAHLYRSTGVDYTEFWLLSDLNRTFVTVDEVEVTPRGIDPAGEISKAHLVLTGPVITAKMRREFGEYSVGDLVRTEYPEGAGEEDEFARAFKVHFDYSLVAEGRGFVPDMALVSCLKMVSAAGDGTAWSKRGQVFYLVLRWVEEPEPAFERIGIANCSVENASKFEELEEVKTVRII